MKETSIRLDMNYHIMASLKAGFLIGIGDIVMLMVENKYLAALLFSFGLWTIIESGYRLYTGQIANYRNWHWFYGLGSMLYFNLMGVSIPVLLYASINPSFRTLIETTNKFDNDIFSMFIKGLLCGVCMYVAVRAKAYSRAVTVMAVMIFILAGFEHCIADFPYLICHFNLHNSLLISAVMLGNTIGSLIFTIKEL